MEFEEIHIPALEAELLLVPRKKKKRKLNLAEGTNDDEISKSE